MAPMLDTNAAEAGARALQQVGGAIAAMGKDGMELAGRLQAMDDTKKESDLFLQFNEQAAQFSNSLLTRQDIDQWIPDWKQQVQGFKQQVNDAGLSPAAKARMELRLAEWSTSRSIQFEKLAALQKIEGAKGSLMNLGSHAAARGDRDGVNMAIGMAKEAGLRPDEVERLALSWEQQMQRSDMAEAIRENPVEWEQKLSDPKWIESQPWATEADRVRGLELARGAQQANRSAEIDMLKQALDAGVLQQADIEATTWLSDLDRKQWTQALQKTDPPSSETHSKAWDILFKQRDAFADPKVSDEEYAKMWNDNRTAIQALVPSKYQGDINSELHYRSPANRKAVRSNPPGYEDSREIVTNGYSKINRALKAGVFGSISEGATRAEKEAAYDKEARLKFQYRQIISANPNISIGEAQKIADDLISGEVAASAPPIMDTFFDGSEGMLLPMLLPPIDQSDGLDQFAPSDLDSFLDGN